MEGPATEPSTVDGGCGCHYDTTEIKQGRWNEEPYLCIQRCKAQFLRSVLAEWTENSGWVDGCRTLNGTAPVREFWSVYWCDSTFCGVGINQTGGLGQDRE